MKPKVLIRSLKGSAAQVLLAFLFARRAMDVKEIQSWTNLKRETIYNCLPALEGLVVKQGSLAHGREVFAPGGDLLPFFQMLMDFTDNPELETGSQESVKRTSGPTTTTTNGRVNLDKSRVVVVTAQESVKRTPGASGYEEWKMRQEVEAAADRARRDELESFGLPVRANLKACKLYGIGEPMATQISEMKHVTPEFIVAHIKGLERGETKGLAIVRIRSDEMPRLWLEEVEKDGVPSLAEWHEAKEILKRGETDDDDDDESEEE